MQEAISCFLGGKMLGNAGFQTFEIFMYLI
jgi:hypothetical protein